MLVELQMAEHQRIKRMSYDYLPAYNPDVGDIATIMITSTTGKTFELKIGEMSTKQLWDLYDAIGDQLGGELNDALLHQVQCRQAVDNSRRCDAIKAERAKRETDGSDIAF
jgi:hypothetical protein